MKIKVLSAPEVAYLLRRELGPLRNWDDTLADMRRGRVEVNGDTLLPICKGKYAGAWRPMYAVADVLTFIAAVRAAALGTARHVPYQVKTAYTDPTDTRPWYTRKLSVASSTHVVFGSSARRARAFTSSV
ncbi:hypothetical protein SAMN05428966_102376 [Massilia sp. PDC64]|nr:hypothetical protein [Massilia sp. PDC64]SDC80563.1 hypothetical protein SAMN05428966_102376 [Massilia sp. PDC64]